MNIIVRPSKLQLSKYPLGALVESEALKILTHLNICRICEATIESLKGIWDTLTCQLLQSLPHDLFLRKTAYQRLLDTLHSPYQSPAQATSGLVSHPDDFLTNWQAARRISTVGKIGRRGMKDRFYYVEPVSEKHIVWTDLHVKERSLICSIHKKDNVSRQEMNITMYASGTYLHKL